MSDGDGLRDFGATFKGFLQSTAAQAPSEEPPLLRRIREHFGGDPANSPILTETFDPHDHPNLQNKSCNTVLFELLNQMDGLAEDADILFLLTTNRPDILEPALASRPGRIDQALEVPTPDGDCRRKLLALYSKGTRLALSDEAAVLQRTEGVSAAFIRELLRKATLFAAEDLDAGAPADATLEVRDHHLQEAIRELIIEGGPLTQSLLGATAMKAPRRG